MEDQSTDSGDLTAADAAAASAPQGKAARNRHRLPRQKATAPPSTTTEDAAAPIVAAPVAPEPAAPEVTPDDPAPEAETAEADTSEPDVAETEVVPAVQPEPTRKRRSWRRAKAAAPAPETEAPSEEATAATTLATGVAGTVATDTEATGTEATELETSEAETPEEPEPVLVPHRPAGRPLKVAAVIVSALFVAAAAFAGATIQPYLTDRAAARVKFEIAETAANAITTLWTYTPEDMDRLPERSAKYLGGDFAVDYKRYIDAIAATNKQAQVTNNTQVLGAAVESLTPTEASAIVYTNSVATSPVTKGIPSLRYLSYRLVMKPQGSHWLITQMVAVTKLDLTPRL